MYLNSLLYIKCKPLNAPPPGGGEGRRAHDRMVVGCIAAYANGAYHH